MTRLFTAEQFRSITANLTVNEQREYSYRQSPPTYTSFDVFLSYNIADMSVVKGIYYYLTKKGFDVYLDCIVDPYLKRENCDYNTASLIHNRLIRSKSLVYACSHNSTQSNWMPWELGVVDGNTRKCYVLPVSNGYERDFQLKEYLQLYPMLVDEDSVLKVQNRNGSRSEFNIG